SATPTGDHGARRPARRFSDRLLVTVSAMALLATAWAIRHELGHARSSTLQPSLRVGAASVVLGGAKRRAAEDLVWERLRPDEGLASGDGLYVPDDGLVEVRFVDGTSLVIEPGSLVVLDAPPAIVKRSADVALLRGGLSGVAGTSGARLHRGSIDVTLDPEAQASVGADASGGVDVRLHRGTAHVGQASGALEPIAKGELVRLAPGGHLDRRRPPVELMAPDAGGRVYFAGGQGAVEFSWRTEEPIVVFELADDRGFERMMLSRAVHGSSVRIEQLSSGAYFWRVRHPGHAWSSEARAVALPEDRPPVPIWPGRRQILYLPGDETTVFLWTSLVGVRSYQLQIARDAHFQELAFERVSSAPQQQLGAFGPEGLYYWRVRSQEAERGESPYSATTPFRLIVEPLPAPPDLFDAELELPDAMREKESPPPASAPRGSWWTPLLWSTAHAAEPAAPSPVATAVVLRWQEVPGIERYRLEISEDARFAYVVLREDVSHAYYRWGVLTTRPYWWRVLSVDAKGRVGLPSGARRIEPMLVAPEIETPAAHTVLTVDATLPTITFRWRAQPLAASYELQLARDGAFTTVLERRAVADTIARWQPQLAGRYYWRVRARGAGGESGDYCAAREIELGLAAPRPVGPPADAVVVRPAAPPPSPVLEAPPVIRPPETPVASPDMPKALLRWQLGLSAGWLSNFARWGDPIAQVDLAVSSGRLPARVALGLRAGYRRTVLRSEGSPAARAVQTAVPVALGARYAVPLGLATTYGEGAAVLGILHADLRLDGQAPASQTRAALGVAATAGLAYPTGPGELFGELGGTWLRQSSARIAFDDTGARIALGYRVRL
ncbi:MAG: hypothetical protein AAB426_07650, partial [Myxococcota bacterium]